MKLVTLLRHAKSSWANPDQDDHDRPLNARGNNDAPDMAERLLETSCNPDLVLCSSAIRTQQTAAVYMNALNIEPARLQVHEALYLASAGTILEFIQQTDNAVNHVMIIGHNPGLEILGRQLHPAAPAQLPTCAVLHFALHGTSFKIGSETEIELLLYDFPKSRNS